jgi:ABC-type glycerol-3-phosphate transport system substrate-binding protein
MTATMISGLGLTASAEGEKREVNFYYSTDMISTAEPMIEAFNASQDEIEVVAHTIPESDYDDKIKVMTAGGSEVADVIWTRSPAQTMQYVENGALTNLAPYAEASGLDLSPIETSLQGISDEDGGFYGLPDKSTCWMLFYNKTLFDEAGLDYPINITWDEYMDLAASLTSDEGDTKMWGTLIPNWEMNLAAIPQGTYLDSEDLTYTEEYAKILHRLYVEDESAPGLGEMQSGSFDVYAYFETGNYYTMINGDWTFRLIDPDFEYGAAPLPIFEGGEEGASTGQASFLAIPTTASNPDDAYTFIEFYTTSVEGTSIIAAQGDVPAYATDEAMEVYNESVTADGVEYRFSAKIYDEEKPYALYSSITDAFKEELNLYLLDEQDLETTFDNYIELREEILEED